MKGIILAGGSGTRLYPLSRVASKHLQPVYDKPMIYYPLSTLMMAGVSDILIISTPNDVPRYRELLGGGSAWGVNISYSIQASPAGIAQALLLAEGFLAGSPCTLILGDNIFYGRMGLDAAISNFGRGALIFGYPVEDPTRYGIVELSESGDILSLEEKPAQPRSNLAVPGLYLYDSDAPAMTRELVPSPRGELEITDLNRMYLAAGSLRATRIGRGVAWLDSGTQESLLESSNFIATIEKRQGLKIACPEEVAYNMGYLDRDGLLATARRMPPSPYRDYVVGLAAAPGAESTTAGSHTYSAASPKDSESVG